MANSLLTPTMVTKETLRILENMLTFSKYVNREYDDRFAVSGAKIGATLTIRKPNRFTTTSNTVNLTIQDITDPSVVLTITTQAHVDSNLTTQELTLSIDEFRDRILKPKVAQLANFVDAAGTALYANVWNTVGTAGVDPSTAAVILGAGVKLDNGAVPRDGQRSYVQNPAGQAAVVDALKGLFQSSGKIADQYEDGTMGNALGFKMSMDQNIARHTNGTMGGTPLVNGASLSGSTIVIDGWTGTNTITAGTVFTIAGVNAVNPQSYVDSGVLQQFVVVTTAAAAAGGTATLSIQPAMTNSGAFQTVTALAADNAVVTVVGTASQTMAQNLAFHKDAFTLATVDLEDVSKFGAWGGREQHKGISLRVARQYRIGTDDVPCRTDILFGWKTIYPELACRVVGA